MIQSRPAIGILDPCSRAPYGLEMHRARPRGGTEATVLKIVGALKEDFRFRLFQTNGPRRFSGISGGSASLSGAFQDRSCCAFIVINSWKVACRLRRFRPDAPIVLWLHVHPGRHNRRMGEALLQANITVICISQSHARQLRTFLAPGPCPDISHIWNPIADDLQPDATPRNPNRLLFASSPHKGLKEVLTRFSRLRKELPDLILEVADPGGLSCNVGAIPEGVWLRGILSHDHLIARMRRALCLFSPQNSFAEPFGLVLAEANAVGTPVLVQRGLGANDEIVCDPNQLIDSASLTQLANRIRHWQTCFPRIRARGGVRLTRVAAQWQQLLAAMLADPQAKRRHTSQEIGKDVTFG